MKQQSFVVVVFVACLLLLTPYAALSAVPNAVDTTFCNIIKAMSGSTGKALETLCVIILGIMMLTGKLSMKATMFEIVGAGLVVGAGSVVVALGAGSGAICP